MYYKNLTSDHIYKTASFEIYRDTTKKIINITIRDKMTGQ